MNMTEGHRERLRLRFKVDPGSLTEAERLELLLTYAIPRRDVSSLARELIERYGSIEKIISAPIQELALIPGIGESTDMFFRLLSSISGREKNNSDEGDETLSQLSLFGNAGNEAVSKVCTNLHRL
jgi:DNA repair protein RadC